MRQAIDEHSQRASELAGSKPYSPAPAWFDQALADRPARSWVATARSRIEALSWGKIGNPGLLLVHGNSAHADWWSFIAPFLASRYRVAAMSLPGMGGSDWRDNYLENDFPADAAAVAKATSLTDSALKPVYIGHSFGGRLVLRAACSEPERLSGAILIDTLGGDSEAQIQAARQAMIEQRNQNGTAHRHRIYSDLDEPIGRFRLMPSQPVENQFILRHIARNSLREVCTDTGTTGWTWKFDPEHLAKHRPWTGNSILHLDPELPFAHIVGAESDVPARDPDSHFRMLAAQELQVEIPAAAHHVLIDQPLALISALRAILSCWSFA